MRAKAAHPFWRTHPAPVGHEGGALSCGPWKIEAEMSPARPAAMGVRNEGCAAEFLLKDEEAGASVILEVIDGPLRAFTRVDELPCAARGLTPQ